MVNLYGLIQRFLNDKDSAQFDRIASFGRNLNAQDLRVGVMSLTKRGVARRWSDRYVSIEPRPIAMWLAEQQWQEWGEDTWDKVLADSFSSTIKLLDSPIQIDELGLHVQAAKQLKLLNQLKIAQDVVKQVCRDGGPLDNLQGNLTADHAEVLSYLAEVNPSAVAEQIERLLNDVEDLSIIAGGSRSHLVRALEKISFPRDTFEDGARLLLRLAAAENQQYANNATRQFIALFSILLGGTQADGTQRLDLLDDLISETGNNIAEQEVLIKSLAEVLELNNMRVSGVEAHGTQPALNPWKPKTKDEEDSYIRGCVTRLFKFAAGNNATSALARDILGTKLGLLVRYGFIDIVEYIVKEKEVEDVIDYWPEALDSFNHYLSYHSANAPGELRDQVRALMRQVEPKSLEKRLCFLVKEMRWNYLTPENHDHTETIKHQDNAVREVASEAIHQPDVLRMLLPELSRGQLSYEQQRRSDVFGKALAECTDSWDEWLELLIQSLEETPEAERCYQLLSGYVRGLAARQPGAVEGIKQRASVSPVLAPILPLTFPTMPSDLGLNEETPEAERCYQLLIHVLHGFDFIISALQNNVLCPSRLDYPTIGKVLHCTPSQVTAHLLDVMLDHNRTGFASAINLLGIYILEDRERLESFRPQVRKIAENMRRWSWTDHDNEPNVPVEKDHFKPLIMWILKKGPDDQDAVATAKALAKAVANLPTVDFHYNIRDALQSILPVLLSQFSGVAWPLIGAAIISTKGAYVFQSMMREKIEIGHQSNPPILSLPEDTLFAWCHAHPEHAPTFAASAIPFLISDDQGDNLCVHPVIVRLLEDFGDREDVIRAIDSNMCTGAFGGPMSVFYEKNLEPVKCLLGHSHKNVQRWAKKVLRRIHGLVEQARDWDAHSQARFWE